MAITDPNGIANLWTWVDATVGVDDPRSQLTDQNGGIPDTDRNLVQVTEALRPSLTTVNGIDAVDFDGTTWMASTEAANEPLITISTVIRVPLTPVDGTIFASNGGPNLFNKPTVTIENAATTPTLKFGSPFAAGFEITPDDDWAWGEPMVVTWTYNITPDLIVGRVNGVEKGSTTIAGVGTFTDVVWGASPGPSYQGTFQGLAIVAYERVLNGTELDDLDAWMADTYVASPPPPPPTGVSNTLGWYNPILFI